MSELFFGQCRFCLAEGSHRDLKLEYYESGAREVYYDMFVTCFNLHLRESVSNTLICLSCVKLLRVASKFRARVLDSEQKLINASKNARKLFIAVQPLELVEREDSIKVETFGEDVKKESFEDEDSRVSPVHHKDESAELVSGEAALLSRFRAGSLAPLPTRNSLYSICGTYVAHLDRLRGKVISSKKILKHTKCTKPTNESIYLEKLAHVANVSTLLENSNITPFRSRHGGFQCFYCKKTCENLQELRDHQSEENKTNIKRLSLNKGVDGLVIYVEVTDIKCTLCDMEVDSLKNLKAHLIKEHKKEWHSDVEDRVIPFKINQENGYECQICKFTFETFVSIERHMNVHFRNYVCECGSGFMTKHRLNVHVKTVHKSGTFPCELCKKMFDTAYKYRIHVDTVHKKAKRSKCPKCFERFSDCHKRQRHMVDVHGLTPLVFKCNVCEKTYSRRYQLTCHMKRSHLEGKEIQCEFCPYMCCTNSELNKHMVSHKGSRSFECDVCKKAYARKKTLTEHMRIHNNDRRFSCSVCGQAFVQNCSLKGHVKTHHPEFQDLLLSD